MKKILIVLLTGMLVFGCTNWDIEFDDYTYQSIYFPYQMPIRSIILGDEAVGDNTIDRERAFTIGLTIGGTYENNKNREITVQYAPELAENIIDAATGDTLELLPESYYTAGFLTAGTDIITIPSGQMSGKTRVQLNDAFFQDPLSTKFHYVIPLNIIDAGSDTILSGIPASGALTPDPRVLEDWNIIPRNYTMFGIRYINELHGYYLYRGQKRNLTTDEVTTYSERFLTDNPLTMLSTSSQTENIMSYAAGQSADESFQMHLTFDLNNQTITVSRLDTTTVDVSGSGVFYTKDQGESESYNDNKHRTIYLAYNYSDGTYDYAVNDSLVFVDTDVRFEEYTVTVYEP